MTNILIPYTFIAGTKAKAEEVNANFQTLKSAVETTNTSVTALSSATNVKVGTLTNLTTADKTSVVSAINELNEKKASSVFCINSGYINSSNEAELLSASSASLSFKIDDGTTYGPLKATTASGESFELASLTPIDMSGFANGTYNVFVGSNSSVAYVNTIYRQKTAPSSPSLNDVWVNTLEPLSAFKYSGTEWEIFSFVPAGQVTVASGVITTIKQPKINDNGYNVNKENDVVIVDTYINGTSGYRIYSDGFIEQWGRMSAAGTDTVGSCTLIKAFSNTNYSIMLTSISVNTGAGGSYSGSRMVNRSSVTTTSFGWQQDLYADSGCYWEAKGY